MRYHFAHGTNSRLIPSNWCASQVPMSWLWFYRVINTPIRKADHLSLATRDTSWSIAVSWANNMHFNLCEQGWFLPRWSHILFLQNLVVPVCYRITRIFGSHFNLANRITIANLNVRFTDCKHGFLSMQCSKSQFKISLTAFLERIAKYMSHQYFRLYGITIILRTFYS